MNKKFININNKNIHYILSFIGIFFLWFFFKPSALEYKAWNCLIIFLSTILSIILKIFPIGAIGFISLSVACLTKTIPLEEALLGYKESAVWITLLAFFISKGIIKTNLGKRMSYYFVKFFGKNSMGLAYGFSFSEMLLAPSIPSITARTGGIISPIIISLGQDLSFHLGLHKAKSLMKYITLVVFQTSVVTSAMFLTAMAANPIIVSLAQSIGVHLNWNIWIKASIVPGMFSVLIIPYILYLICSPQNIENFNVKLFADTQLNLMGKFSNKEFIMSCVLLLSIILWIFGDALHIHNVTTAFLGVTILLITKILDWDDILNTKIAWDTFIWFGALFTLALQLNKTGVIPFFSNILVKNFSIQNWKIVLFCLSIIYFYSHYFFASVTAHISAMYTTFLSSSIILGVPPLVGALMLAFISNLFGGITHYGIGSAPILISNNYVSIKDWWIAGFIMSIINLFIFFIIGLIWWKFLGYW